MLRLKKIIPHKGPESVGYVNGPEPLGRREDQRGAALLAGACCRHGNWNAPGEMDQKALLTMEGLPCQPG